MLNRRHIRVKVMQSLYSYFSSPEDKTFLHVEDSLLKNINRLYDLYLYLLLLVREIALFAERYDDEIKSALIPSAREINVNSRFYSNQIVLKLNESKKFNSLLENHKIIWDNENVNIIRKVFHDLKNTEIYQEYIRAEKQFKHEDYELLSFILKHYTSNSSSLDQHLEDSYMNWLDDERTVVQMAVKSLKSIAEDPENDDFMAPVAIDEDQLMEFASTLLKTVFTNNVEFETRIKPKIAKWEPSRIATIDSILLKMGIAEFTVFPTIPVKVTINEYIELSKNYSSPQSKSFINGVLDNILEDLQNEGKLNKKGIGLIDK